MAESNENFKPIISGRAAAKNGVGSCGGYNFCPGDKVTQEHWDGIFKPKADRECKNCGRPFTPHAVYDLYCDVNCLKCATRNEV